jgi:hypothetical protein
LRKYASFPHDIAGSRPGGGGTYFAITRKRFAEHAFGRPARETDLAAALARAHELRRRALDDRARTSRRTSRARTSNDPSATGSFSRVAFAEIDRETLGGGALAAALEQRRHEVDADDLGESVRGRERGRAVAGRDVQHALAGAQVDGLAEDSRRRSGA